ncbi:MAG TPA: 2OG-Fe(II) oxygenase [Vitreimonas sp.]|uniref:2OG-Fe(II) oxygenase n=1 Tax=Vitreimonas sp. TaxID=3069702 RepID=UPI002D25FC6F|nr:2OG-Fe(II) oxygenase [Vitreimonas sp.]HYD89119.1 2OG-Fe(II) oxygenase [Vitreimonas sp.]
MDAEQQFQSIVALLRKDARINEEYVAEEVEALARAGHAEAMALAATIAGAGYGRAQSWPDAFAWLAVAAGKGHAGARGQFEALGVSFESGGGIDVEAWTEPRWRRWPDDGPRIGQSEGFLEPELCDYLIARAAPLQASALVYDPISGRAAESDIRSNSVATFGLLDLDLPLLLIRERIAATMGVPVSHLERTSVFRYLPGQTFGPHYDFLQPSPQLDAEIAEMGQRPLTFLVYLNDAFEGGETRFLKLDRKFKPAAGGALFFYNVDEHGAPDPLTEHEGAPPTRGEKWLLSQFIRDKPQLPG